MSAHIPKKGRINCICGTCGSVFTRTPCEIRLGRDKYCSRGCVRTDRTKARGSNKRVSLLEVRADIRRLARELGHYPTSVDYAEHGRFSLRTVKKLCGGWRDVIEGAGLRYEYHTNIPTIPERELRADFERLAKALGHPPKSTEYAKLGRYSLDCVYRRACHGGKGKGLWRWAKVLHYFLNVPLPPLKSKASKEAVPDG